jgi:signal transduction histidine kinase
MDDFVARQNVTRFRNELENGAEGARRQTLLKLLIAEEERLGLTRERHDEINQQIVRIKAIISKQRETIDMLKANGHSMERAESSLANLSDLLAVHEEWRERISAAL